MTTPSSRRGDETAACSAIVRPFVSDHGRLGRGEESARGLRLRLDLCRPRRDEPRLTGLERSQLPRTLLGLAALAIGLRRERIFDGGFLRLDDHVGAAFTVDEPDVVDRVLHGVETWARGEHPPGEDPANLRFEGDLVDLHEGRRVRTLRRRARVADLRRHLKTAELHRLLDGDLERDRPAGDLVEAGEHGRRVFDLVGVRDAAAKGHAGENQGGPAGRNLHRKTPPFAPSSAACGLRVIMGSMVEKGHVFARHVHWRLVNGGDSVAAIGNARRMMLPSCPSDAARKSLGFMTLAETRALADRQVVVPDPGSTLVSSSIRFGSGVVLWPNTTLQCLDGGAIAIGPGTIIFPGTRVVASGGVVTVGSGAELGEEGGFTIKADAPSTIRIGDGARLLGGGSLTLSNTVGTGRR